MAQVQLREDPMSRIQREIIEVTEREREFREGHFRQNSSTEDLNKHNNNHNITPTSPSIPTNQVTLMPTEVSPITNTILNGHAYKKSTTSPTKGLMQRFIANKGRVMPPAMSSIAHVPILAPTAFSVPFEQSTKPIKKRRTPVKEKIANELKEMRDREYELKRMRKKRNSYDSDISTDSEDDEELGESRISSLKSSKSISELYTECVSSGTESSCSPKPAKSLAELCDLPPGEEYVSTSSIKLIAKWESLIRQNID